jgi:aspartyl aminopeptidase
MVAAHTDSPCLKVKPISKRRGKDGFLQVAVETYGGGLWNTWFDRDLGLAGRITMLDSRTGRLSERLVNIAQYLVRLCSSSPLTIL